MMSVFPIRANRVDYASLFHAGHGGVDIFAERGSEVLAVADGRARAANEQRGGLAVYLTARDGTQYYYGHLDAHVGVFPREVRAGEPVGLVGDTGSARGKTPHVHFEVKQGGVKVDPAPLLDAMRLPLPSDPIVPVSKPSTGKPSRSGGTTGEGLGLLLLAWAFSKGKLL